MVPDPFSLSRRQFLGGLAGAGAAGTVAVGATVPTALPDVVTDQATKLYPTPPELSALWRPTVTEVHATEAVTALADTVERGRRRWEQLETDEHFLGAGGWLENAREALRKDNHYEAVFDAITGIQYAGESLGIARAKLGEADVPALAKRADALVDRVRGVADDIRPYSVSNPARDLAWYYRIDRALVFARFHADWGGMDNARDGVGDENGPPESEYDARTIGTLTGKLLQAERYVRNAEHFHDRLADKLDSTATPYADHLGTVATEFRNAIDSFPDRSEVRSRVLDDENGYHGPYAFAHSRLVRWCFDHNYRFGWDESRDLLAHRAVELSKGVAQRRAYSFARENLVVEEGQKEFDSGHTLAEKRRARSVYRSVVGSNPPPLLTQQVGRAVEDLQVAEVGFVEYDRPLWRDRLKAYLYALVGRAKLREYPAVYDAIVDGS